MRRTSPAFFLLLALPLGAAAANRVGDADNSGSLNATDAALVQARVLGIVDEWGISPLALADADTVLDIADVMLVAQAANGQRVISGPGSWLNFLDPPLETAISNDPPIDLYWAVYSSFYGVAEAVDGLAATVGKIPAGTESRISPDSLAVAAQLAHTRLWPINSSGANQTVTARLRVDILPSSGAAPLATYYRNAAIYVWWTPVIVCGNEVIQTGETCDDGFINGSCGNCNATCTGIIALDDCGDGVQCGVEACDNGPLNGQPNQCNATCTGMTPSVCGNAVVEAGEACDDGIGGLCLDDCSGKSFLAVSAGGFFSCGIVSYGNLACWGNDDFGQATPPAGIFLSISAGGIHACGIKSDNTVACWGDDYYGEASPPSGTFLAISTGFIHACGIKSDDTVACWGDNLSGQATPPGGTFLSVSAGYDHTCGVRTDNTVACWGNSGGGESTPPGGTFLSVSAGESHTCGISSDDTVACWGSDYSGQATPPGGTFLAVSAGGNHTCGVKSDNSVACWGRNDYGQATATGGTYLAVSTGYEHTCAVRLDNTVACWGENFFGQATPP